MRRFLTFIFLGIAFCSFLGIASCTNGFELEDMLLGDTTSYAFLPKDTFEYDNREQTDTLYTEFVIPSKTVFYDIEKEPDYSSDDIQHEWIDIKFTGNKLFISLKENQEKHKRGVWAELFNGVVDQNIYIIQHEKK